MKLEVKGNKNYCGTIVKVDKIVPIEGADKIVKAFVLNTGVVVSKDVKVGDVGIFFPVETALSESYLKRNNLYRDKTLNADSNKTGFFELNGRIRCVKLRGSASEGLYMPISSLDKSINDFKVGDEFDTIDGIKICEKYIVYNQNIESSKKSKKAKSVKKKSKLIPDQFRLHYDTAQLKKNLHKINRDTLISVSDKWHGTSLVVSNILTKKKLSLKDKIAKFFGVNVIDKEYSKIYSSRKVIKNEYEKVNSNGYYNEDIWGKASGIIYPALQKGMTAYCEIVGYLESGKEIQKGYYYGCKKGEFDVRVYRITMTNSDGDVIEMPFMQMKKYCDENGLNTVPLIYYGRAIDFISNIDHDEDDFFESHFLNRLENIVQNKECEYNPGMPKEGVVIKIDGIEQSEAFKYKNIAFLEYETKMLDNSENDIESE